MSRRAHGGAALLLAPFAALLIGGCARNACEARPAEAQIDVLLRAALPDAVATEVSLRVNDGAPLVRAFPYRGSLGFVFELGALDAPPRQLAIGVVVRDARGAPLALGALRTSFVPNGCNFFSVEVAALERDGGADGPAADAGADRGTDAAADAGADLDAAADAGADLDAAPRDALPTAD